MDTQIVLPTLDDLFWFLYLILLSSQAILLAPLFTLIVFALYRKRSSVPAPISPVNPAVNPSNTRSKSNTTPSQNPVQNTGFQRFMLGLLSFAIFILGFYLFLAAAISLSYFKQTPMSPAYIKPEVLHATISQTGQLSILFRDDFNDDPFALLSTQLAERPTNTETLTIRNALADYRHSYSEIKLLYTTFLSESLIRKADVGYRAEASYALYNRDEIGSPDQVAYFDGLTNWVTTRSISIENEIALCGKAVRAFMIDSQDWSAHVLRSCESGSCQTPPLISAHPLYTTVIDYQSAIEPQCQTQITLGDPPKAEYGSSMGVFTPIAGWLIKTGSLALVLMTGLLGAGLVGAVSSPAIHSATSKSNEKVKFPLEFMDLATGFFKSMLAAFIAFLAVVGGITFFFPKDIAEPYIVLLTCLLAAILSEKVWAMASSLKIQYGAGQVPQNPAPASTPPQITITAAPGAGGIELQVK
jgi:hypothetical protein